MIAVFASVIFVTAQNDDKLSPAASANTTTADAPAKARIAENFGKLPLSFELNKGQIDKQVKFVSHGPGYELFLTSTEAVLRVRKSPAPPADKSKEPAAADANVREGTVLRLKMLGANATPQVEGQDELPGKVHYFIGNDPANWRRNIPTYKKAYFKNVYPGIDVVYYGQQQELEYDFVVGAGADPKLIRFIVEGAEQLRLDKSGKLLLGLKHGEVSLNKPVIYQVEEDGSRREVKGTYVINRNEVRFKLERFDSSKPLIIDPVLSYSTLLGSSNNESGSSIAVDSSGNAYITGNSDFTGFPTTPGAFKTTSNNGGAFVTKLDQTGTSLVYSTYLNGNNGNSTGFGIAVDSSGNAYVTGNTSGNNFPTLNGLKTTSTFFTTTDAAANWNNQNNGLVGDINVLAVAPNTPTTLYTSTSDGLYKSTDGGANWSKLAATGLSSPSFASALAVDPTNASVVYISLFSGLSKSTDGGNSFTTINTSPINVSNVSVIVFDPVTPSTMYAAGSSGVFKSTDSGSTWIVQNNFGVPGTPSVRTLAIDPSTPLTIYAGTFFNGLFKSTNGGSVWTAMNNGMTGSSATSIGAIAIDPANTSTIYVGHGSEGGIDKSTNGATSWSPLTTGVSGPISGMVVNSSGVFAAVGNNNGIIKSTNGGTSWDKANAGLWNLSVRLLVPHPSNASILYVATGSSSFSFDAFVTKLNATGSALLFSTLLGGNSDDTGNGIAVDANGNIYVAGQTSSLNFPVANAVQGAPASKSCSSGFVTKINPSVPSYVFSTYLRGSQCDSASAVTLDNSANVYVTGQTGSSDFLISNAFQPTFGGNFSFDAFVTKLTTDGTLTYSTYLGGNSTDSGLAIAADSSGNAYVTGSTFSTNFPTQNPIQPSLSASSFLGDAFLTKISSNGSALVYSTFLGGTGTDAGRGVAIDSSNNVYVTGYTDSVEFPLTQDSLRTKSPIFKSVDGAANWSNDNFGFAASTVNTMVIHPTEPSTVYAGTQTGVFKTTNGGRTWTAINNGLGANKNVTAMVINPSAPATLYLAIGGFQSGTGVYKSTDSGATWALRNTGLINTDLLSLAIVPSSPNTLYLGVSFCCVPSSHIYKTTDGADNWAPIPDAPPQVPTSIVVDPLDHATIYVSDTVFPGAVYKSTNSGSTWQKFDVVANTVVRSVAVSPHTAGLVFASTDQGVFKSVNGGANWTPLPNRSGKIYFDPVSPTTVYLLSNFFTAQLGVFKSTDTGQTWTVMNKGLGTPSPTVMVIDPLKPSTIYLANSSASAFDAFVTKINAAGNSVVYSTLIGGPPSQTFFGQNTQAFGIALDSSGNVYVVGTNSSAGFPVTPNAFQPFLRGANDAFISKLANSYIISGRVLNSGDVPLANAEVVLSDGTSLTSVLTENDGSYQFSRLREGGNYTVSASKPHFTMTPASQTFNNLNSDQVQDFSALISDSPFFTIGGQITENGNPLSGVTVTLSGSQTSVKTTDSNGNYSFELIVGGNYTVTPSIVGFNFAPANQTFNSLSANQTANFAATRQSFVVTNANNHGPGSLRDAITNANATPGTDTITFNIPGSGVKTISVLIALPEITDRVVIDGTTQPGYAGTPLIEIDGLAIGFNGGDGLMIRAGGSAVKGLSIANFRNTSGINLNNCDGNLIQANYIGVAANGTTQRQNQRGIQLTNSNNNVIGGTTAATRNVISGNSSSNIEINTSNGNVIQGNFIGTNAAGTAALPNSSGVVIFQAASIDNVIGGTAPGAGNLISGHNNVGVSSNGTGTLIQGNLIGTDVNGTNKIPNSTAVSAFGTNILVGGVTAGARNIISGNNSEGVSIRGAGSKVQGNYIGTDITGTLPLGNNSGVSASDGVLIGGTAPEERNIISGNNSTNVVLGNFGSGAAITVRGNYIGTDVTGTRAVGTTNVGLNIGTSNNIVGGLVAGARNVISGNTVGIQLGSFFSGIVGNVIQGNYIGLNASGTGQLPNVAQGILIFDAVNSTIGGTQNGAANKIAFNGAGGVVISGNGQGNAIRGNSIFSNTGLGIDLGANGVTANDGTDPDTGANNLQNFPILTGVLSSSNSTTIQGSLKSLSNTTFQIDFYTNAATDPSGNGEGAQFFSTTSVTTNNNGDATINATFPVDLPAGRVLTATATDPNGNTSEFSAANSNSAVGSVQFSVSSIGAIEDVGTLPVTVLRTGGSSGSLSVDYATANGTAIAGQDYTSTSGTLTFNDGETSKTISIPITDDGTTESDETFTVTLRNDANLEVLGAPSTLTITVQDKSTVPTLNIDNVQTLEGNTGTTTDLFLTVSLSAATGRAVSVNYASANFGAFGGPKCNNSQGIDYEGVSGTLSFNPGQTSFTIPVKICGDNNAEANEGFRILLTNPTGATLLSSVGTGAILNDDVLELLIEESGPIAGHAAAVDALLGVRDPFTIVGIPDWWPMTGTDKNTRVAFFTRNLQLNPGELSSAVFVRFTNPNAFISFQVQALDVRPIPNTEFTQVTVRLPTGLPPATYSVQIIAHQQFSNAGTIRIQ
ncbi:MAG TPA: SBBP repeat-containing protein [Pyrinomonadaceae bacterium]|nr:SBBP repeat-containing protein [Pyrinomonadaceae bacterium]